MLSTTIDLVDKLNHNETRRNTCLTSYLSPMTRHRLYSSSAVFRKLSLSSCNFAASSLSIASCFCNSCIFIE
nr:hypothetical protein Iba_chr03aCG10780 [Ipomoea batatas]